MTEPTCSAHPEAPHGFDRTASHSLGRYVCDCEGWQPDILGSLESTLERAAFAAGAASRDAEVEALRAELALTNTVVQVMRTEVEALRADAARTKDVLGEVSRCLHSTNMMDDSPICDTIWYSDTETLFDFIDAAIAAEGKTP